MSPMTSGRIIDPTGSRCAAGLSVSLPASFAVWSPRRFAAHPWATSCTTAENMTRTTEMTILKICVVEYEAST